MEKEQERYSNYSEISKRVLERMIRYANDGDFDLVFGSMMDLTTEDEDRFIQFLKEPKMQKIMAAKFEELATKITESPELPKNLGEQLDNIIKMFHHIKPEIRQRQSIRNLLARLQSYAEENDPEYDQYHWKMFTS